MPRATTISHSQFLGLLYHDLFDYPLTRDETRFWQVGQESQPRHIVTSSGSFLFLPGKQEGVLSRGLSRQASEHKFELATKAARVLSLIPSVEMVGITGALSMGNALAEDDIDLMVVTAVYSLWITRLISLLLLSLSGLKIRRFGERNVANKICLNLWLNKQSFNFYSRKEIYTAHEILQIKILFDRGGVYRRLLLANKWTRQFFPQAFLKCLRVSAGYSGRRGPINNFSVNILRILEIPARIIQFFYMSAHRTREIVDNSRAMLHPMPWNEYIPQIFLARLEQYSKGKSDVNLQSQISD